MAAKKKNNERQEEYLKVLIEAKERHSISLFAKGNVHGVGIGKRTRGGRTLDEVAIKVYVTQKVPKDLLAENDLIPSTLKVGKKQVPVDVEESRIPEAQTFTLRSRPLIGGSSIGSLTATGESTGRGTLGVCVTLDDEQTYILSCDHVLTLAGQLPIGAKVTQPSLSDGGIAPTTTAPGDVVGTVSHRVAIDFSTTTMMSPAGPITLPVPNLVDAALARVDGQFNGADRVIHWVGYPSYPVLDLRSLGVMGYLPRRVHKMGRTTDFTVGLTVDIAYDTFVDYSKLFGNPTGTNRAKFVNQIRIAGLGKPFSEEGDSGSLIVDADSNRPLGLLVAGQKTFAIANHIKDVLDSFHIPRV